LVLWTAILTRWHPIVSTELGVLILAVSPLRLMPCFVGIF
jgi:hypothetical protein